MTNRKRQFGAWAVGLIMATPLLYVLSFGPACWWFAKRSSRMAPPSAPHFYWPVGYMLSGANGSDGTDGIVFRFASRYATLFGEDFIILPSNYDRSDGFPLVIPPPANEGTESRFGGQD